MRIGIVADIHDAVSSLRSALALFREREVEQVITLGDAFDSFRTAEPAAEAAGLLQEVHAVGVWGNHDVGLSYEVTEQTRDEADPGLLRFAARLEPQIVVAGCRFCHIEPWKNPCRLEDLWDFDGVPDSVGKAQRCFGAVPERILFVGHFHSWLVMNPKGRLDWDGVRPITLDGRDRYLVLVSAVVEGWCAMFETEQSELTPIRCSV